MTCENCIHYEICNENAEGNIVELMKEPCFRFMDKDIIRHLFNRCAAITRCGMCFCCGYVKECTAQRDVYGTDGERKADG